jgi:2-hydroxy-3-oxopropionate reductase
MSTISPVVTQRLAAAVAAKGGSMLDAPVSGGEIGAKNGTLTIMVGGEEATFTRAHPIFACMGTPDRITYIGSSGAGQVCKLCNQICIGGALAAVAEAFALASKNGIDRSRVRQALSGGFAASKVLEVHGGRMLTGDYKPGFFTRLYQKDLRLVNEAAIANSVAMPGTAVVTQLVNALVASGRGDLDCAAVAEVVFEMSGVGGKK